MIRSIFLWMALFLARVVTMGPNPLHHQSSVDDSRRQTLVAWRDHRAFPDRQVGERKNVNRWPTN